MTIFTRFKERIPEQKELKYLDEKHDGETDDEIFDRKERLSNLEHGEFATADRNTIFSAILQELKEKAKKKT